MNTRIKSVKKCPTFTKEVIIFDKKGKRVVKTVEVSDHYLIILNNGNSIAVKENQLKHYGIVDAKIGNKTEKVAQIETNPADVDDDDDSFDETATEVLTESAQTGTSLVDGSQN